MSKLGVLLGGVLVVAVTTLFPSVSMGVGPWAPGVYRGETADDQKVSLVVAQDQTVTLKTRIRLYCESASKDKEEQSFYNKIAVSNIKIHPGERVATYSVEASGRVLLSVYLSYSPRLDSIWGKIHREKKVRGRGFCSNGAIPFRLHLTP